MQTVSYQAIKLTKNLKDKKEDFLVVEAPLQININNTPYTVVMRTPANDIELVRGLLFAEDIYKRKKEITFEIIKEDNKVISIINTIIPKENLGKGYLNKRTLLSVSSCGICGKTALKDIVVKGEKLLVKNNFEKEKIHKMFLEMYTSQRVFQKTGGSHAAAIFNKKNTLLTIREDIGRHNAVDKTIGYLILQNTLKEAEYLLVSGRVSYEIITKAFIAKIPVVIAVSACSSLAVDFAKEFGICLIGFTRDQKMTIYTNPAYLK